jgi:hypothetical protein
VSSSACPTIDLAEYLGFLRIMSDAGDSFQFLADRS